MLRFAVELESPGRRNGSAPQAVPNRMPATPFPGCLDPRSLGAQRHPQG
jgi:hypothetical protein